MFINPAAEPVRNSPPTRQPQCASGKNTPITSSPPTASQQEALIAAARPYARPRRGAHSRAPSSPAF